jgi:hypothetical protein
VGERGVQRLLELIEENVGDELGGIETPKSVSQHPIGWLARVAFGVDVLGDATRLMLRIADGM